MEKDEKGKIRVIFDLLVPWHRMDFVVDDTILDPLRKVAREKLTDRKYRFVLRSPDDLAKVALQAVMKTLYGNAGDLWKGGLIGPDDLVEPALNHSWMRPSHPWSEDLEEAKVLAKERGEAVKVWHWIIACPNWGEVRAYLRGRLEGRALWMVSQLSESEKKEIHVLGCGMSPTIEFASMHIDEDMQLNPGDIIRYTVEVTDEVNAKLVDSKVIKAPKS
ncbi:MAG: hypothetical protein V1853_01090 [bacterium]